MVSAQRRTWTTVTMLSVLALSSRFDGPPYGLPFRLCETLSVLALSSRFDGHAALTS